MYSFVYVNCQGYFVYFLFFQLQNSCQILLWAESMALLSIFVLWLYFQADCLSIHLLAPNDLARTYLLFFCFFSFFLITCSLSVLQLLFHCIHENCMRKCDYYRKPLAHFFVLFLFYFCSLIRLHFFELFACKAN